tara:strand:- start:1237 stop:1713 length:477 start_codon:yes stop_codon:yes gene_type:complete
MGLQQDLLFGKKYEKIVMWWLNKYLYMDDWVKAYRFMFKKVDFKNTQFIGELKTRTCSSTYYPDTMFGFTKMKYLRDKRNIKENEKREFIFFFLFTNGLFKWIYKDGCENEYTIKPYYHKEKKEYEPYCYVKQEYLILVTTDITSNSLPPEDQDDWLY